MGKRMMALLLSAVLILSLAACGQSGTADEKKDTSGGIEVEKELFDVVITIPEDFVEVDTQEELDEEAKGAGYQAVLNEDGSVTYTMTKSQHKAMLKETKDTIDAGLKEMVESEEYSNFVDIETNSDYTEFIVKTTSTEVGMQEGIAAIAFYVYGALYNAFNGTPVENIHIEFINAETGEVLSSSDSKDLAEQ